MSAMPDDVKHAHVINAADARSQASEGRYSFMRSEFRRGKPTPQNPEGEVFEIPHKDLFDNEQQERWDDLQAQIRKYQREPDVLAPNGALIAKGNLVYPHHWGEDCEWGKEGERVKPSWGERLAIVLWGEEGATRAKAAGINFNEIEVVWAKQKFEMEERLKSDPKSGSGGSGVAPASN
ncbi:tail assembly chaperone [Mycobacterium phage Cornie]|uniref:Tail assembly chaperone n=1 Tax=Mycobacterium phage Cornie TaxID=2704043 RepID=A0A6G6XJV2_9CAUD|nr:tail assembly chaperone [Mycobacterium phage Cornie]QIG58391.1 tail assembly chaperone [Mycobacterium phage Cornie]